MATQRGHYIGHDYACCAVTLVLKACKTAHRLTYTYRLQRDEYIRVQITLDYHTGPIYESVPYGHTWPPVGRPVTGISRVTVAARPFGRQSSAINRRTILHQQYQHIYIISFSMQPQTVFLTSSSTICQTNWHRFLIKPRGEHMFLLNEFKRLGVEIENPKDTLDPIGHSVSPTEPNLFHWPLSACSQHMVLCQPQAQWRLNDHQSQIN